MAAGEENSGPIRANIKGKPGIVIKLKKEALNAFKDQLVPIVNEQLKGLEFRDSDDGKSLKLGRVKVFMSSIGPKNLEIVKIHNGKVVFKVSDIAAMFFVTFTKNFWLFNLNMPLHLEGVLKEMIFEIGFAEFDERNPIPQVKLSLKTLKTYEDTVKFKNFLSHPLSTWIYIL